MTDSKSVTRFLQTKLIPPPLWNACDFVLQFHSTIAYIPGKMNTAADFLSRLEKDPNEKIILKTRKDIPTKLIVVNIESTDIAQKELVFIDTTNRHETAGKELWKHKGESRNAISNDPPVITVSWYYANNLHTGTTIVNIAQLTKPWRIPIERDSDPILLKLKRGMLGRPIDEKILINDACYMHYSGNKKRNIIKDDTLCKKYYNDLGEVAGSSAWTNTQSETTITTWNSWQTPRFFKKRCKKSVKSITSPQLQHMSETGSTSVKYAYKLNTYII